MSNNKHNYLNHKDFIKLLAYRSGLSAKTVSKVYDNMLDLIKEEIKFNGEVRLNKFCRISTKYRPPEEKLLPIRGTNNKFQAYCKPSIEMRCKLAVSFKDEVKKYILAKEDIVQEAEEKTKKMVSEDEIKKILMRNYGFTKNELKTTKTVRLKMDVVDDEDYDEYDDLDDDVEDDDE